MTETTIEKKTRYRIYGKGIAFWFFVFGLEAIALLWIAKNVL